MRKPWARSGQASQPGRRAGSLTILIAAPALSAAAAPPPTSQTEFQLPYSTGTLVSVFDDDQTHRPIGALDLIGEPRGGVHRIVAAADGVVMAIEDSYSERQSGRAAALCRNNYVWLAHPNGEWSLYSHMRTGSSRGKAGLKIGQAVRAGHYLGDEGEVGCAMLQHLHFEVAVPPANRPIDAHGFVEDNDDRSRNRVPRFCLEVDEDVVKDKRYTAATCPRSSKWGQSSPDRISRR